MKKLKGTLLRSPAMPGVAMFVRTRFKANGLAQHSLGQCPGSWKTCDFFGQRPYSLGMGMD